MQGVTIDAVLSKKAVTIVNDARSVKGSWIANLQRSYMDFIELTAVFLFLQHFFPFLWSCCPDGVGFVSWLVDAW